MAAPNPPAPDPVTSGLLAQEVHVSIGLGVIAWAALIFHGSWLPPIVAGLALLAVDSVKEFTFDLWPPPRGEGETVVDGLKDLSFYTVGILGGLGLLLLLHLAIGLVP